MVLKFVIRAMIIICLGISPLLWNLADRVTFYHRVKLHVHGQYELRTWQQKLFGVCLSRADIVMNKYILNIKNKV